LATGVGVLIIPTKKGDGAMSGKEEGSMALKSRTKEAVQVALLSGHCIVIGPEGRDVPPMFLDEAFREGCIPVGVVVPDSKLKSEPSGAERNDLIKNGIKQYLEKGETLTNSGLPRLPILSGIVGFTVTKEENATLFNELQLEASRAASETGE
jgi:hypothetical protein